MAGTEAYFVLGLTAFGDIEGHADAPDDLSLGIEVRPDAQIVAAIAAGVFHAGRDAMEREKMLLGGWFAVIPAAQVLVDGLADRIARKAPGEAGCAPPMGSYPQLQICGPKEKWNLFHQQTQVRFCDGAGTARRKSFRTLHNPDDFAPSVAYGRTLNPDGNTQAALVKAFRQGAGERRGARRIFKHHLVGRQFVQGQQAGDGLSDDLGLGETVELRRGLIPEKYGSIEIEADDRFVSIREK